MLLAHVCIIVEAVPNGFSFAFLLDAFGARIGSNFEITLGLITALHDS